MDFWTFLVGSMDFLTFCLDFWTIFFDFWISFYDFLSSCHGCLTYSWIFWDNLVTVFSFSSDYSQREDFLFCFLVLGFLVGD